MCARPRRQPQPTRGRPADGAALGRDPRVQRPRRGRRAPGACGGRRRRPASHPVTVWNEHRQERSDSAVAAVYPDGIHGAIAAGLRAHPDLGVRTATLDEPEHGLTEAVLADTDVLTWWGHVAHGEVATRGRPGPRPVLMGWA